MAKGRRRYRGIRLHKSGRTNASRAQEMANRAERKAQIGLFRSHPAGEKVVLAQGNTARSMHEARPLLGLKPTPKQKPDNPR